MSRPLKLPRATSLGAKAAKNDYLNDEQSKNEDFYRKNIILHQGITLLSGKNGFIPSELNPGENYVRKFCS